MLYLKSNSFLFTLIINIKKENKKPLIRPKIQSLPLRNSSPILGTGFCSYRYSGMQNTPMITAARWKRTYQSEKQHSPLTGPVERLFSVQTEKEIYVPLLYAGYLFQQLINRVGKKNMNIGNTRNTIIHLAVDTDVMHLSIISFPFTNSHVPEHKEVMRFH